MTHIPSESSRPYRPRPRVRWTPNGTGGRLAARRVHSCAVWGLSARSSCGCEVARAAGGEEGRAGDEGMEGGEGQGLRGRGTERSA
eukprot:82546-Chlamydomonas_euryale.AAC.3